MTRSLGDTKYKQVDQPVHKQVRRTTAPRACNSSVAVLASFLVMYCASTEDYCRLYGGNGDQPSWHVIEQGFY
jgi:hypothetical protein